MLNFRLVSNNLSTDVLQHCDLINQGSDNTLSPNGTQSTEEYLVRNNVQNFNKSKVEKGNFQSIYYSNLDTFNNKKTEIFDIVNNESPQNCFYRTNESKDSCTNKS